MSIWEIASTQQLRDIIELLDNLDGAFSEALTVDEYHDTIASVREMQDSAFATLSARERLAEMRCEEWVRWP